WTKDDLIRDEAEGNLTNIKDLSDFDTRIRQYDDEVKDTYEGTQPSNAEQRKEKEIFKVWKYIDLDGDGIPEDWLFFIKSKGLHKFISGHPIQRIKSYPRN
ncbi:hypothetical protein LCGC14_1145280, partial [marine sediment metagenome]